MASYRVCADGGANRLYDATYEYIEENLSCHENKSKVEYLPDLIRGDLDSLEQVPREFYSSCGIRIEQDNDQETNDLDKALQAVREQMLAVSNDIKRDLSEINNFESDERTHCHIDKSGYRVFVYGAFGGRFDQEMASMQTLYKWGDTFDNQIYLYNDDTCAFLLPPTKLNEIRLANSESSSMDDFSMGEGPTCGLIPLGFPCSFIKTTGLKWDLDGSIPLEFGGLVSTSNRVMKSVVTIIASHPIVFTAEIIDGA